MKYSYTVHESVLDKTVYTLMNTLTKQVITKEPTHLLIRWPMGCEMGTHIPEYPVVIGQFSTKYEAMLHAMELSKNGSP